MRPAFRLAVTLAIASAMSSCRSTTAPDPQFSASASGSAIRLSNEGTATVFYMIMDSDVLPLIEYAPCTSKALGCRFVSPRSEVTVPGSEVIGFGVDTREVVVVYWIVRSEVTGDKVVGEGNLRVALH